MLNNILTIDVEDYYSASLMTYGSLNLRVQANEDEEQRLQRDLKNVFGILRRYDVKATFFVVGYIAEKYPKIVKSIYLEGHDIGSHSYNHNLINNMSEADFCDDLKKSTEALERNINRRVNSYRAPAWSYKVNCNSWFWKVLNKNGIRYDSSIFPTKNFLYGVPDAPRFIHKRDFNVIEIPPSTLRYLNKNIPFSGGFYLRVLPYWFIRKAIRAINRSGQPAVVYLHPYEVGEGLEKILGQTVVNNFIHHYRIPCTKVKFENLLKDFRFCSIADYFGNGEVNL